jgi:excinuclease ABC subunit C
VTEPGPREPDPGRAAPEEPEPGAALRKRIAALPTGPGVYLFEDERGQVLYVGKAQNLRQRVRSYFQQGGDGRFRVHYLVPRIHGVEVVVTQNVKEALLLENQLIKKHKPRFNVRLRDDKNYLGLRIDPRQEFARFTETRRFLRDGASYFGPYTSSVMLRRTLGSLQRIFPLRTCSEGVFKSYRRQGRPCIEHSLGRCAAPCVGKIDAARYGELVQGAIRFMKGQGQDLVRELREQMAEAAREERFEEAARLRDRIDAVERTVERQAMVSAQFVDRDVFGLAREGRRLEVQVMHVRQGKLTGGRAHSFSSVQLDDAEALDSFLAQYYGPDRDLPREILLPLAVESADTLEALFSERAGQAVHLEVPQRGERRRLVELAEQNATLVLAERSRQERSAEEAVEDLQRLLGLERPPERIECYDTSHLQGHMHVGSRVTFTAGEPEKDGYRRYKLREAAPGDDYAAMREILMRRLERLDQEPAPDLILLDGGKGQLSAVRALLADRGLSDAIALAALAKERDLEAPTPRVRRHGGQKREKVFLPHVKDPLEPPPSAPGMLLLQRVRDESHRFAIRYHRELRSKLNQRSILDELPGIGPVKRRSLLRHFGSLERVKRATLDELAQVERISRADAERIAAFFAPAGEA